MSDQLVGRRPVVAPTELVEQLRVPPHFGDASFDTYRPDASYPSQERAKRVVHDFSKSLTSRIKRSAAGKGLYLDGGFGVGKTHLLAAAAHQVGAKATFGSFVEYTHVVGALGFAKARDTLATKTLVCIDEFELDDPGDTLIMARLMRGLTAAGVAVIATSNTLPDSLGEGRFAAEDFKREIQAVASVFDVVTIDGLDYRHRGELDFVVASEAEVDAVTSRWGGVVEQWDALIDDLAHVHPSKFSRYIDGVRYVGLRGVSPLRDQAQALRLVSLVDRLYDADVSIVASGEPLSAVFTAEMLRGGYRKKYFRALSRLSAMTQDATMPQAPLHEA